MRKRGSNIYLFLLRKLLLAFATLIAMQVMFYLCNLRIFHVASTREWFGIMLGNIVFCAATVATFLLPYMLLMLLPLTKLRWRRWYRIFAEVLYLLAIALMVVPRASNAAYYQFTYRLLSDEIFSYLGIGGQMDQLLPLFARDYWYAWVVPLLIAVLFLIVNSRIRLAPRSPYAIHTANDIAGFAVGMAAIVGMAVCAGTPAEAARYCQPKNTALVCNDAYNILHTMFTPELVEVEYMSGEEAARLMPTVHHPLTKQLDEADSLPAPMRNVVIIVVEGLGQEYMGCYNETLGKQHVYPNEDSFSRTPFLDSLAQYCMLYDGRANGKKSIEGITAINTGIPNLMSQPFTNSPYGSDNYSGLPATLKRHGYHTAFFHGSYNGVMDFDKMCQRIGFDEYLGKDEYDSATKALGWDPEKDYDGAWGIYDEKFLQYTVQHISTIGTPFMAEIFTVTSHHPYPIPDIYKKRFVDGSHPILKCIEYTDFALQRFFEEAQKQPWFENTLFIITGDHSAQGLTREYNDYDGWYRIPMMVVEGERLMDSGERLMVNGKSDRLVQQTDIYPTIVDWLGLQETFVCFGQSIIQQPNVGYAVHFGNGYYCLVSNDPHTTSKHNIAVMQGRHEGGDPQQLRLLKALIQQYNSRLINNNLILSK